MKAFGGRYKRESFSRAGIIFDQPGRHAIGVFAKNAFPLSAVDVPQSLVIASLNARESVAAVHDIRFAINNRAAIKSGREQIASIHVPC